MTGRVRTRRILQLVLAGSVAAQLLAAKKRWRWLRLATRPMLMLPLCGCVLTSAARPRGRAVGLLAAGLVLSAAGDTALACESTAAVLAGIALFAGTHVCYLAGCVYNGRRHALPVPALLASAVAWAALTALLWRRLGPLRWAVAGYGLLLLAMALAAYGVSPLLCVGAALFVLSDLFNGFDRAGIRFPSQGVAIGACYLVGQSLIAWAWTRGCGEAGAAHGVPGVSDRWV